MRFLIFALLVGCTSAPSSLEGMKQEQRWVAYKDCRQVFRDSRTEGVIIRGVDEFSTCTNYARKVVR